jgi:RNA polymerase sigma-70 factor (ECF subfamily)
VTNFSEIYGQYVRSVYRFLLALTENETLAEDLTQQTFYKAFLHIDRFEGRCSLYIWLCQIGKNEWLLERRIKKPIPLETVGEMTDGSSIEENFVQREQAASAKRALLQLPEPYKDVLILRIYGDLPFAEIAATYHKSESWAKVTFFRGKEKLRKIMEDMK